MGWAGVNYEKHREDTMRFEFVKQVEGEVTCYTGEMVKTGSVIDLPEHLAKKARVNPNYKEVKEVSNADESGTQRSGVGVPGKKSGRANSKP
jgi:hypothetical protein